MSNHSTQEILTGGVAVDAEVVVSGWVRTARVSKKLAFIHLTDGSSLEALQVVAPRDALENFEEEVSKLTSGCSVKVRGRVVESRGASQAVEVKATAVEVVGWVDDPETYPIQPKQHSFEYLREIPHLRVRTRALGAMARVRHVVSMAVHRFFSDNGFVWVHTPIVTTNDCEGAGELFRVTSLDPTAAPAEGSEGFKDDFFGRETFLTVSGQLNVESYCLALGKVYTFGPCFRSENSNTSRHLSEFWMIEPEVAFTDLDGIAGLADDFLRALFSAAREECGPELEFFAEHVDPDCIQRVEAYLEHSIEQMDYTDAIKLLEKAVAGGESFEFPVSWGIDLQSEHEKYLTQQLQRPVVVKNYPRDIKAFYMRLNDDDKTVAAMDVLAPGVGEIIGGSQREDRLDVLDRRMVESGIEPQSMDWYRDLRRYGSVPHAGFGLGLERALMCITGMGNIRDVIPFPRAPKSARG